MLGKLRQKETGSRKNIAAEQAEYAKTAAENTYKIPILYNCFKAFFVGGGICALGEFLKEIFMYSGMTEDIASASYLVLIIAVTAFLTGFGIYDRAEQFAGAGLAVPISGFANSVGSAMLEYRSEGFVLGMASNAFKLAGCVIVWGSIAAVLLAMVKMLGSLIL